DGGGFGARTEQSSSSSTPSGRAPATDHGKSAILSLPTQQKLGAQTLAVSAGRCTGSFGAKTSRTRPSCAQRSRGNNRQLAQDSWCRCRLGLGAYFCKRRFGLSLAGTTGGQVSADKPCSCY